jgi:hypothetical protein
VRLIAWWTAGRITRLSARTETLGPLERGKVDTTDERRTTESDGERSHGDRSAGPVGTVLGATLGPFGAAIGVVVDEDRFAVRVPVDAGGRAGPGTDDGATAIEITDPESDATGAGASGDADREIDD